MDQCPCLGLHQYMVPARETGDPTSRLITLENLGRAATANLDALPLCDFQAVDLVF